MALLQPRSMRLLNVFIAFAAFSLLPSSALGKPSMESIVESTSRFLIKDWVTDPKFADFNPPQVIPISGKTKIYGGCGNYVKGAEVGGSSYCPKTHTIYLVPEQMSVFYEAFGPSSVAYIIAHEFGHAIQYRYDNLAGGAEVELQADCLAGVLIDIGSKELSITRDDSLQMAQAAYAIGDPSHGSGAQRAYALLSGMGVFKSGCSNAEMKKLLAGQITDPAYLELSRTRSGSGSINTKLTPYPKSLSTELGL